MIETIKQKQYLRFYTTWNRGWRDGSAFRVMTAIPEDSGSVLSTHTLRVTICLSSLRVSDVFFYTQQVPGTNVVYRFYIHTHTYTKLKLPYA